MQSESQFRNGVVVPFLKTLQNCYFFSVQQMSLCGDPDIVCCVSGKFVALELKTETGRASKLQLYKMDKIRESGGVGFVVTPENFKQIKVILKEISKEI